MQEVWRVAADARNKGKMQQQLKHQHSWVADVRNGAEVQSDLG